MNEDSSSSIDRDIGYLSRSVEDLTRSVEEHMVKDDQDREDLKERFRAIQDEINYKDTSVNKRVDGLQEYLSKQEAMMRKYLLISAVVMGSIIGSIEHLSLVDILSLFS